MEQIMTTALDLYYQVIQHCIELLTTSPFSFGNGTLKGIQSYVSGGITVVATAMLTIIWLIGMGKSVGSIDGPQGPSTLFFQCFRLFIPSALISSYLFVCNVIISAFMWMITEISYRADGNFFKQYLVGNTTEETNGISDMFDTYLNNNSFWERGLIQAVCFIFALIFAGVVLFVSLKILFVVYGRYFKWYIIIFCCPIAISCFGSKETEHIGMKYLETLAKCSMQGLVILLSFIVFACYIHYGDSFLSIDASQTDIFGDIGVIIVYIVKQTINLLVLYGIIEASENLVERII